jgi:nickel/cobalt transporter (NiCoT) family protein
MTAMVALVFVLGLRHGFDPDHLVAIDGLTRSSQSRWCGLFFSLGHGAAITLIGVAVAIAVTEREAPAWLEQSGTMISTGVLLVLGLANLVALARTPGERPVSLIGLRPRWALARLRASHPAMVAAIGAAFAVSFDTVSHALAFSLTGATMAGALFAALLGLMFTLGMVIVDAINGLWVARMMSGTASRWMSAAVGLMCLTLAAAGMLEHSLPAPVLSVATLAVILAVAVLASRSTSREARS